MLLRDLGSSAKSGHFALVKVDGKWAVKMECGVHVTVCEPSSVAS